MNFVTEAENAVLPMEETKADRRNDESRKDTNNSWSVRSSLQYREEEQEKDKCF